MEQLDYIINGGETKRFHTVPVLREQCVDAHSFHVAMLVSMIALDAPQEEQNGLTVPLLMAALTHDLAEHKFGDMPAPTKRAIGEEVGVPEFRKLYGEMELRSLNAVGLDWEHMLTPTQLRWLKLADAMQGALYCIRERLMGNRLIEICYHNFRSYLRDMCVFERMDFIAGDKKPNMEEQILFYIDDMWEQADV